MKFEILHFVLICIIISVVTGTLRKETIKEICIETLHSFLILIVGIFVFVVVVYYLGEPTAIFN